MKSDYSSLLKPVSLDKLEAKNSKKTTNKKKKKKK
jgi:hypothetical protein